MGSLSLAEFADKVSGLMPVLSREFLKHQSSDFYKTRITMPQFVVLDLLNKHGEPMMSDLARYLNVTTAAITGIVDRLVRDGYIVRVSDPEDRRIVKVKLTAKGDNVVHRSIEHRKKTMMNIFGMISEKEREEYLKILMHIHDHIAGETH